jgi:hypothetical protein
MTSWGDDPFTREFGRDGRHYKEYVCTTCGWMKWDSGSPKPRCKKHDGTVMLPKEAALRRDPSLAGKLHG